MANVHQFYTDSSLRNYNYFVELSDVEVMVIDPLDCEQVEQWCLENKKTLTTIYITHEHPDHIAAKDEIKEKFGAKIWSHESAKGLISNIDRYFTDREEIKINEGFLEVVHTPGHTPIHSCLLIKSKSGQHEGFIAMDTVFNAGVGHCKLGGDPKVLHKSIKVIGEYISDDATLYPGHDYIENNLRFTLDREPSNEKANELLTLIKQVGGQGIETDMGMEKEINVFFRLDSKSILKRLDPRPANEEEVFLALRRLRDNW